METDRDLGLTSSLSLPKERLRNELQSLPSVNLVLRTSQFKKKSKWPLFSVTAI